MTRSGQALKGLPAGLLVLWLALAATARADAETGHRYLLRARLDAKTHRIEGQARITWLNRSRQPARELAFHLYPNAFAHEQTVFMREGGRRIRGGRLTRTGGIEVSALGLTDGTDLLARARDNLVADDRTQLTVPLPHPVPPGGHIELHVSFTTQLPSAVARSGFVGSFHMVAQWFPKLARREPDGRWAQFPYRGLGEFYADFADYRLELDVPADQVVAAPGERIASHRQGARRHEVYRVDQVHDVAWAAYPHFETHSVASADGVQLRFFAPPGYGAAVRRQASLVRRGLAHFGRHFGPYPYPELTVIIPPRGAGTTAGMEYPRLFVSAGSWLALPEGLPDVSHDNVVAHELAHQWFSSMVASNEVAHPFMDEGLTQWAGMDLLRPRYGAHSPAARTLGLPLSLFDITREWMRRRTAPPSSLLAARALKHHQLARAVYVRPALVLETVARVWGRDRLLRTLGSYARRYRFRHPRPADLFAAFDAGYYTGFSREVLRPALEGQRSEAWLTRHQGKLRALRSGPRLPLSAQRLDRTGPARALPWPKRAREQTLDDTEALRAIALDPHHQNLLDSSYADNHLRADGGDLERSFFSRLLFLIQLVLTGVGP